MKQEITDIEICILFMQTTMESIYFLANFDPFFLISYD